MTRPSWVLGLVVALVLGCSATTGQPITHPRASSPILGVRAGQSAAAAASFAYDPSMDGSAATAHLKEYVAHLRVQFSQGIEEIGAGVLVCRTPRNSYVLTAAHVVDRSRAVNEFGEPLELGGALDSVTISFYRDIAPEIVIGPDSLVSIDAAEDVALLRFGTPAKSRLAPAELGSSNALTEGAKLRTFGHAAEGSKRWIPEFPQVNERGGRIGYRPAVNAGFSGGPLFDDQGRLVGINSHTLLDLDFSQAVPIERAYGAVEAGLDPLCPRLLQ